MVNRVGLGRDWAGRTALYFAPAVFSVALRRVAGSGGGLVAEGDTTAAMDGALVLKYPGLLQAEFKSGERAP